MKKTFLKTLTAILLLFLMACTKGQTKTLRVGEKNTMITVERFKGEEADVNSYLLSDANNIIVVDLLRNSAEAEKLADYIEASDKKLKSIFITHGHPDHYMGLGVFQRRFPDVPVQVASVEIRDDIIQFSQWMESVGWLEKEPHMKVKSKQNPKGFDYSGVINVLDEPYLDLSPESNRILVNSDFLNTESGHMTTLTIPEQKIFLGFDLLYDKVHAWCGPSVGQPEILNWIQALDEITKTTSEGSWTFYAGHGGQGDESLVKNMKDYLEKFLEVTAKAKSRKEAIDKMKELFPGFAQEDFLLVHSINFHVKDEK